jgi:hypothetical protein
VGYGIRAGITDSSTSPRRHGLSGINVLILWSEASERGYTSSTWMTYRQAPAFGGLEICDVSPSWCASAPQLSMHMPLPLQLTKTNLPVTPREPISA